MASNKERIAFVLEKAKEDPRWRAAAPAVYRLLWRVGLKVPPPVFQGRIVVGVVSGVGVGVLVGLGLLLLTHMGRAPEGMTKYRLLYAIGGGVAMGMVAGLGTAFRMKRIEKELGIKRQKDVWM